MKNNNIISKKQKVMYLMLSGWKISFQARNGVTWWHSFELGILWPVPTRAAYRIQINKSALLSTT